MSWSPLEPLDLSGGKKVKLAVTLAMLGDSKRYAPMLRLVLRTGALPCGSDWLKPGGTVSVAAGHGENAGKLRITPGGSFLLAHGGGRSGGSTLTIRLPIPRGVAPGRRAATPLDWDAGERWVEVDLPDWARSPVAEKRAYVGVTARVGDPAAVLRGRA